MDRDELEYLVKLIEDDALAIIHHQTVLADVKDQLAQNRKKLFEQDWIYAAHYGQPPSIPQEHFFDGIRVTTQVLHQTGKGLRDIAGADLLYEIEGVKYALIQYKVSNSKKLILNDSEQLDALLSKCPNVCTYHRRSRLTLPLRINGYCGCWYNCVTSFGPRFVHSCEAKAIFEDKKSVTERHFRTGLTETEFNRLFAVCRLGALVGINPSTAYISKEIESNHLVFYLKQFSN